MSEFMQGYGVADARRGRIVKLVALFVVTVAVLGTSGYFYFRTWSQERTVDTFFDKLEAKDFAGAYAMWCNAENPCPYYPIDRFQEDWGEATPYAKVTDASIDIVEYCGDGVFFKITYPNAKPVDLMVERASNRIGFAPWEQCPGKKRFTLRPLMDKLFGSSNPKG